MKKIVVSMVAAAFLLACVPALAYEPKVWDDLSWWGNSGAKPDPYKDPVRSGYWWWPTEPASNAGDAELWGNRGVVYNIWTPPAPPQQVAEVKEGEKPVVKRETPVFNNVLFDFDKAVLKPEGKAESDKVVQSMKEHGKDTLVIEGHTCDLGSDAYNMGLGQRRADSVMKYLVDSGIAGDRIQAVSKGETEPAVPNDSEANRKLNRRAVFKTTVVD